MDNLWLAALDAADRKRIEPHLSEHQIARGQMLYDAGEAVDQVWFPLKGVVSLMTVLPDDKMVETAAIGREGLVGVTCGPFNARAASRAISQRDGVAVCCSAEVFGEALDESEGLRQALSRFTEGLMAQVQQAAACNAQHRLDERLARWLLTLHDRAEDDRIDLTQADIAGMLGVRRATVSEVGTVLEGKDLIQRGRGWVRVLDRDGLEEASCGCYGLMREVMKDLELPQPQAGSEAMRSGSSDA
ncbi:MAG: Crp/Fnr family transcriptional regulator [Alphaproteobacteria bacterium]|jgi:CRP-like cAMP-binding protein|uniref:Crp/Fnr family transcriptional regulator n=1 Tax=Brevundimonas mediterranea TaxID=74329 RepID=A0A6G7EH47_9CAUL|nr:MULTISPECIES: Crp/Fnr family transcriptional regulator [Brevundimonas]MBU4197673.1 Crp/Fnr family transcriptional regulator [Alphaproteobacteria bacterium]OGN42298.1 MAG: cyclic nucleotide-binding protein [Caulobacterales bacterium RIFCSPHIGHO2_01_FULL_67_30]OGN45863.1 MAG: cyclic nucleotide-binding protein [Caulobacterales bacterium GWE1_67_11]OGN48968.1 MAG: cyclic nucleotide-binding protein [Caulobacterales bacterium RIFCSPHIGHO2_12_FULL_68_13]OGN62984.1 MAG: cyclic nucleotide-binding pr